MAKRLRTATIFLDDSGSSQADRFWGLGAVRTQRPDVLQQEVGHVRDLTSFGSERFHFHRVTKASRHAYRELSSRAHQMPDLRFYGLIVDKRVSNPADYYDNQAWRLRANLTAILLGRMIQPDEHVAVMLDRMPPPPIGTFEQVVLGRLRGQFNRQPVVSMVQLSSHACDGLQVADLFTSAMMHAVRQKAGEASRTNPKALLVADIRATWNLADLVNVDSARFKTITFEAPKRRTEQGVLPITDPLGWP